MAPRLNLLLFHSPGFQSLEDWQAIAAHIADAAPDIAVRIAENGYGEPDPFLANWQVSRPSLLFSPRPLETYLPQGGAIFAGNPLRKAEQMSRLQAAYVPVPQTFIMPGPVFDAGTLGAFAIAKPNARGKGSSVKLLPTERVDAEIPRMTRDGDKALVQRYIEHSVDGYPTEYRVLTLFGQPLYCARNRWGERRRPIEDIARTDGLIASNNRSFGGRQRETVSDAAVIALAEKAAAAFPDCGLLGVDIIRETGTNDLYVLEVNPNGRTWHFSSELSHSFDERHRRDLYEQFGGMTRAAEILIGATRQLAR